MDRVDQWTVKSISAYRNGATDTNIDFAATPLPELQVPGQYRDHQFTEELQALSCGRRLNGVAGLYYLDSFSAGGADTILGNAGLTLTSWQRTNAFARGLHRHQLRYHRSVAVVGGCAIQRRYPRGHGLSPVLCWAGQPVFGTQIPCFKSAPITPARKHPYTSPHLSVTYKLTDVISAYATYSEGYKSGGFDMRGDAFLTPSSQGYGPEKSAPTRSA